MHSLTPLTPPPPPHTHTRALTLRQRVHRLGCCGGGGGAAAAPPPLPPRPILHKTMAWVGGWVGGHCGWGLCRCAGVGGVRGGALHRSSSRVALEFMPTPAPASRPPAPRRPPRAGLTLKLTGSVSAALCSSLLRDSLCSLAWRGGGRRGAGAQREWTGGRRCQLGALPPTHATTRTPTLQPTPRNHTHTQLATHPRNHTHTQLATHPTQPHTHTACNPPHLAVCCLSSCSPANTTNFFSRQEGWGHR